MRVYAAIVTVLVILVAVVAGWLYSEKASTQKSLNQTLRDKARVERKLGDLETGTKGARETSEALVVALQVPIFPGDAKVATIDTEAATRARQQIGDITDRTDKVMIEKDWDGFRDSLKVTDFQAVLRKLADNLFRNLTQGKPAPPK